jgi:hypothetical protein
MGIGDERILELTGEKAAEEVEAGRDVFAVKDASHYHFVTSRRHFTSPLRHQLCVAISFGEKGCGGVEVERGVVVVVVEVVVVPRSRLLPSADAASSQLALGLGTR